MRTIESCFIDFHRDICIALNAHLKKHNINKDLPTDLAVGILMDLLFIHFLDSKFKFVSDGCFLKHICHKYHDENVKTTNFYVYLIENSPDVVKKTANLPDRNLLNSLKIDISIFEDIINFYEKSEFKIIESQNISDNKIITPQILADIYENIINLNDNHDLKANYGVFYTPFSEIDLMCRLSIIDNISNNFGEGLRPDLNELILDGSIINKNDIVERLSIKANIKNILDHIINIKVIDPSCGGGSFLIRMLYILFDLRNAFETYLNINSTSYFAKKEVVFNSLYGVDIIENATRVTTRRLLLGILNHCDSLSELDIFDLNSNIICGDSLLQKSDDFKLTNLKQILKYNDNISPKIKKLNDLKLEFISKVDDSMMVDSDILVHEKRSVFLKLLNSNISKQKELSMFSKSFNNSDNSFIWEKDFIEIFFSSKQGFDIVIGNPPYVRQEYIDSKLNLEGKYKSYKQTLIDSIYRLYPEFFKYNSETGKSEIKINAKSDLYIYFYFKGFSLLNKTGTLCYLTSNAWLDADYADSLKRFIATNCKFRNLIDNNSSASFESSSINTVIFLASSGCSLDKNLIGENKSRFIMFKKPYDKVISSEIFNKIANSKDQESNDNCKIASVKQKDLLSLFDIADNKAKKLIVDHKKAEKWAALYFRSPDIYRKISTCNTGQIIKLSDIADIRFGLKSGVNDFFYLDENTINEWGIEKEFLKPLLHSLREVDNYSINPELLSKQIFFCHKSKELLELEGKYGALNYIKWGESNNYHLRSSLKRRNIWYSIPEQIDSDFISNRFIGERFGFPLVKDILISDVFFVGKFSNSDPLLSLALLNSSFSYLSAEIFSRKTYGLGVGYLYGSELKGLDIINPDLFDSDSAEQIKLLFLNMLDRNIIKIHDELIQRDRLELDSIIFDKLSLTELERDDIYLSLLNMVETRFKKAKIPVVAG